MHSMNHLDEAPRGTPAVRLGKAIAEARRGMTQRQLARLLGRSQGLISKWENGLVVPTAGDLAVMLRTLPLLNGSECLRLLAEHRDAERSREKKSTDADEQVGAA